MKADMTALLAGYMAHLAREERSPATQAQYRRETERFIAWLGAGPLDKQAVLSYKRKLESAYQAASVNVKLAAVNGFLTFLGRPELRVRSLKIQRRAYCAGDRELTRAEYRRLVSAAGRREDEKLSLLLQTICATGIRVSELRYITAQAVGRGQAAVCLKGKNRVILLPDKLRKRLLAYMRRERITAGPVFVTRTGRPLDRSNIWKRMKALCAQAGVEPKKVFPHNLRHLFARCFYAQDRDLAKLADVLGHSSVNTTRLYIITTGAEHRRRLDALDLVG